MNDNDDIIISDDDDISINLSDNLSDDDLVIENNEIEINEEKKERFIIPFKEIEIDGNEMQKYIDLFIAKNKRMEKSSHVKIILFYSLQLLKLNLKIQLI